MVPRTQMQTAHSVCIPNTVCGCKTFPACMAARPNSGPGRGPGRVGSTTGPIVAPAQPWPRPKSGAGRGPGDGGRGVGGSCVCVFVTGGDATVAGAEHGKPRPWLVGEPASKRERTAMIAAAWGGFGNMVRSERASVCLCVCAREGEGGREGEGEREPRKPRALDRQWEHERTYGWSRPG